jgi:hypothetical protein
MSLREIFVWAPSNISNSVIQHKNKGAFLKFKKNLFPLLAWTIWSCKIKLNISLDSFFRLLIVVRGEKPYLSLDSPFKLLSLASLTLPYSKCSLEWKVLCYQVAEPLWPVTQAFSTFRFNEGEKNIHSILYSSGDSLRRDSPTRFFASDFLWMGFFQASYLVSEGFSNLAQNSGKYSRFLLTLHYCWQQRVDTPRIVYKESCDSSHRS